MTIDHSLLASVLRRLHVDGVSSLVEERHALARYRGQLEAVDPDRLHRDEALAYWLNLYNAGALDLAAEAVGTSTASVLRVPGGFQRVWANVAGEALSLDAIEHAKLRRFGDPRIHGALVCGSASCPTLRYEPYGGHDISAQLDDQLRVFFAAGGAVADEGNVRLSRILLWFGGDFVRPHRMPSLLPVPRSSVVAAVTPWLPERVRRLIADGAPVSFQSYDWSLACSVR